MKPNTPTKIAVHRIITYSCRSWIVAAIDDAAGCRFHSRACAAPQAAAVASAHASKKILRTD